MHDATLGADRRHGSLAGFTVMVTALAVCGFAGLVP